MLTAETRSDFTCPCHTCPADWRGVFRNIRPASFQRRRFFRLRFFLLFLSSLMVVATSMPGGDLQVDGSRGTSRILCEKRTSSCPRRFSGVVVGHGGLLTYHDFGLISWSDHCVSELPRMNHSNCLGRLGKAVYTGRFKHLSRFGRASWVDRRLELFPT